MLRRFPWADEDHRNIPRVALLQDGIGVYIDFPQGGAEFSQERSDGGLGFVAQVTPGTSVERDIERTTSGQSRVFG